MDSRDFGQFRYLREESFAEVYDTDERGPGIYPIQTIYVSQWYDAASGEVVTDPAVLERLERENPPTITQEQRDGIRQGQADGIRGQQDT